MRTDEGRKQGLGGIGLIYIEQFDIFVCYHIGTWP